MSRSLAARYACFQSSAEIGIGSWVHAFHVPLGGQLLSLNQAVLHARLVRHTKTRRDAASSVIGAAGGAAAMKSLSPAGKKATPMLAIATQGLLFSCGVGTLGPTLLGVTLGAALLSVWAFLQPLLIAALTLGEGFFVGVQKVFPQGPFLLLHAMIAKAGTATVFATWAWRADETFEERYLTRWRKVAERLGLRPHPMAQVSPIRGAFQDLTHPLFVGSFLIAWIWGRDQDLAYAIRALIVSGLVFFLIRIGSVPLLNQLRRDTDRDLTGIIGADRQADRAV